MIGLRFLSSYRPILLSSRSSPVSIAEQPAKYRAADDAERGPAALVQMATAGARRRGKDAICQA